MLQRQNAPHKLRPIVPPTQKLRDQLYPPRARGKAGVSVSCLCPVSLRVVRFLLL